MSNAEEEPRKVAYKDGWRSDPPVPLICNLLGPQNCAAWSALFYGNALCVVRAMFLWVFYKAVFYKPSSLKPRPVLQSHVAGLVNSVGTATRRKIRK